MYDMKQVLVNYQAMAAQVKKDLDEQYQSGRIKGTEYANVFNKMMTSIMSLAFETPIKEHQATQTEEQACLIRAQCDDQKYVTQNIRPLEMQEMEGKVRMTDAQANLLTAQTEDQVYVTSYLRPLEVTLREREIEIKEKQSLVLDEDIKLKIAQEAYTRRQIEGFDDNVRQKMLDAQMNAWAMMFSSGLLEEKPRMICDDAVTNLYKFMSDNSGVPYNPSDCPPPTEGRVNANRRSR